MVSRLVPGSALAAVAGAAMFVAASSSPSPAFTLSSPSLEQSVLGADIQDAYWCRWGRCGGWGWHRWGYWHPYLRLLLPPVLLPPLAPLLVGAMGIPLPLVLTSGEAAPAVAVLLPLRLCDPVPVQVTVTVHSIAWVTGAAFVARLEAATSRCLQPLKRGPKGSGVKIRTRANRMHCSERRNRIHP